MRILHGGKEVKAINFGEVEFGVKKEIILDIVNDSDGTLTELQFEVSSDIRIEYAPKTIGPRDTASLRLSWIPDAKVKQPIKTELMITGKQVFKG